MGKFKIFFGWQNPADGQTTIALRDRDGATPGEVNYASGTILESTLTGVTRWRDIAFSEKSFIPKNQSLAMTAAYESGTGNALMLRSVDTSGGLLGLGGGRGGQLFSSNATTWYEDGDATLVYRLYGREVLRDDQTLQVTRQHLTQITVTLQRAAENRAPLRRTVRMLLGPTILTTFATTGFDTDPTTMDLNADKRADWSHSLDSFPADSINSGIWTSDGTLIFEDASLASAKVITVAARMRANDTLGPAIYGPYTVNGSDEGLPIITQLRSDGQGGQELVIYNGFSLTDDPIAVLTELRDGLIDVQLNLIPDEDYLCIEIDDRPQLAIKLERIDDPGTVGQGLWLTTTGGVADFDSIEISIGGSFETQSTEDDSAIQLNIGGIGISLF